MDSEGVLAVPDERVIRDELQRMVLADLLGPLGGPDEEFREDPVDRYILGRLAPNGVAISPDTQDELLDAGAPDILEGESEPSAPAVPSLVPSALGFTASVDGTTTALRVSGAWGRYERVASVREEHAGRRVWRRQPQGGTITVPLAEGPLRAAPVDKGQPHIVVRGKARRHDGRWLVSLFLENRRLAPPRRDATAWIFQAELAATGVDERPVFVPRPEHFSGGDAADQDERRRLAMAYRFHPEFAVGHGTAVRATPAADDPLRAHRVRTDTVPDHEIPFTDVPSPEYDHDLPELADVALDMKRLADLADGPVEELTAALRPLVDGYRAWIDRNEAGAADPARRLDGYRPQVRQALTEARRAADGITLLATDQVARQAFGFANRAMYLIRVYVSVLGRRAETARDVRPEPDHRPVHDPGLLLQQPARPRRHAASGRGRRLHPTHPGRSAPPSPLNGSAIRPPSGTGPPVIGSPPAGRPPRCTPSSSPPTPTLPWSAARTSPTGRSDNLEVGVVLRDPEVVGRLVAHFAALMHPRHGPMRATHPPR